MKMISRVSARAVRPVPAWVFVVLAVLIVAVVSVQSVQFGHRNYREDEINTLYAARLFSPAEVTEWMLFGGVHPAGWRLLATEWVRAFGAAEPVTRYSSTLIMMLTLALVFRLGRDLFDWQVGLIAVLVFGALPYVKFYGHELRPYALVAASVTGMQVMLLRWLRYQDFSAALAYVGLGVLALHTHYFALYFVAAQMLTLVLLVRWSAGLSLRALGLFAALGIAFLPNALSILHGVLVVHGEGIGYALPNNLQGLVLLNQDMQGIFVFWLCGLLIPVGIVYPFRKGESRTIPVMRFDPEWRRWYLILMVGFATLLAFTGNILLRNLTPRNMMIIVPGLAVLAAYEIRAFHPRVRAVLIAVFVVMGLLIFHPYAPEIPYRALSGAISAEIDAGDAVIINVNHRGAATAAVAYDLLRQFPDTVTKDNLFMLTEPGIDGTFVAAGESLLIYAEDTPAMRANLDAVLQSARRVFYIGYYGPPFYEDTPLSDGLIARLEADFIPVRTDQWRVEMPDYTRAEDAYYVVSEYRRRGGEQ